MPNMLAARNGVALSEAAAEAYAIARVNIGLLETFEFRHSGFRDDAGALFYARIVNDNADWTLQLEAGAPVDAGNRVLFKACPVTVQGPDETDSQEAPSIAIAIDGVSRLLVQQLDLAIQTIEPVLVTCRLYTTNDTSGPAQLPVTNMVLRDVRVSETRVVAKLVFEDAANNGFPRQEYTAAQYPGLSLR